MTKIYRNKLPLPSVQPGSTSEGAAIRIEISVPDKPVKSGWAKIDTGGSHTQVEQEIILTDFGLSSENIPTVQALQKILLWGKRRLLISLCLQGISAYFTS